MSRALEAYRAFDSQPVTFATADTGAPDWDVVSAIEVPGDGTVQVQVQDDGRGPIVVLTRAPYGSTAEVVEAVLRDLVEAQFVIARAVAEADRIRQGAAE